MRIQMGEEVERILKELGVRNHSQNILHKKHLFSMKNERKPIQVRIVFFFLSENELCLRSGNFVPSSNNKSHYLSSVEVV